MPNCYFFLTGASYTPPEYYINMRTGTHYFPKGVNTLAIEATRYKFGLNKIEEMSPQDPLVSVKTYNFLEIYHELDLFSRTIIDEPNPLILLITKSQVSVFPTRVSLLPKLYSAKTLHL